MGMYLERNSKGETLPRLKGIGLIADDGVLLATGQYRGEWSPDIVCVVDNGGFTAAGWAFNKEEMNQFQPTVRDTRPRAWIRYPHIRQVLSSQEAYDMMRDDYPEG